MANSPIVVPGSTVISCSNRSASRYVIPSVPIPGRAKNTDTPANSPANVGARRTTPSSSSRSARPPGPPYTASTEDRAASALPSAVARPPSGRSSGLQHSAGGAPPPDCARAGTACANIARPAQNPAATVRRKHRGPAPPRRRTSLERLRFIKQHDGDPVPHLEHQPALPAHQFLGLRPVLQLTLALGADQDLQQFLVEHAASLRLVGGTASVGALAPYRRRLPRQCRCRPSPAESGTE